MKRLIASFAVLGLIATPALAATTPTAKPTNASLMQHKKAAKVSKASLKTQKKNEKTN